MKIQERLREEVKNVTGYDPFQRTRKREIVESRALYIHLLHKYHKKGCSEIARILKLNHATILHSIKNFDIYVRFNSRLEKALYEILMIEKQDNIYMRKEFIKIKIDYLQDKDVLKLSNKVRDMYEEALIKESESLEEARLDESSLNMSYGGEH